MLSASSLPLLSSSSSSASESALTLLHQWLLSCNPFNFRGDANNVLYLPPWLLSMCYVRATLAGIIGIFRMENYRLSKNSSSLSPCVVSPLLVQSLLRYESSTLILCKELSSTIFQSLSVRPSVRKACVTPFQISTCVLCKCPLLTQYQQLPTATAS